MARYKEWTRQGANLQGVDPRLLALMEAAADASPYEVQLVSGHNARASGTPWHPNGIALDVQLYKDGKALPNFQSVESFPSYEEFAHSVRDLQMQRHPELKDNLRWGGYFGGATRNPFNPRGYAVDSMHFDLGPTSAMSGGTWDDGLTKAQRALMPGVQSMGMKERKAMAERAKPHNMTDDDIEALLTGRTTARKATAAPGAVSAATALPSAVANPETPALTLPVPNLEAGRMTDADIEAMLSGRAPGAPVAVAAPKAPERSTGQKVGDTVGAFAKGMLDLPIVGPAVVGGVTSAGAGIRSLRTGESYEDAYRGAENKLLQATNDHPWAELGGKVVGGGMALAPLAAAVPAAFGLGGGNMVLRMLAGGGTGSIIGAADSGVRSDLDPTAMAKGAGIGFGGGAAAPFIGAGVGAVANRLAPYFAGVRNLPAVQNINKLLDQSGSSARGAQEMFKAMGPKATLADLDPALTVEAGALAARGGASTSILKGAMAERAAGANNRVAQSFDDILGPKPNLTNELAAIESRAQRSAEPHYRRAYADRTGHDVAPILSNIDARLNIATGGTADVLNRARGYLLTKDGLPKISTQALHEARQALDDLVERLPAAETSAGKNARNALNDVRGAVDRALKRSPDMRAGDAAFSGEMRIKDAMQEGVELFSRKVRPEDFALRVAAAGPGEKEALQAGARVAIGDALEQAARGELAGAKQMFGAKSANREKLRQLFPKSDDVLDMLEREATMRATEARVAGNSATAERMAAGARYAPPSSGGGISNNLIAMSQGMAMGDPSGGLATAAARYGGSNILARLTGARYDKLAEQTALRLGATGTERDAFVRELIAANDIGNKLIGARVGTGANLLMHGASQEAGRLRSGLR